MDKACAPNQVTLILFQQQRTAVLSIKLNESKIRTCSGFKEKFHSRFYNHGYSAHRHLSALYLMTAIRTFTSYLKYLALTNLLLQITYK